MTPNNYGIIRQPGADLFALRFPVFETGSYSVEEIQLTKHEGKYFPTTGNLTNNAEYDAYTANISKYDAVIFGCSSAGTGMYSGVQTGEANGALGSHCLYIRDEGSDCIAYMKIAVNPDRPWLAITEKKGIPVFAFGIIYNEV